MVDNSIKVSDSEDNVATGLREIEAGERVEIAIDDRDYDLAIEDDISLGHKVAITDIAEGESVRKYGKEIGYATGSIDRGEWVHVHNVASNYGARDAGE